MFPHLLLQGEIPISRLDAGHTRSLLGTGCILVIVLYLDRWMVFPDYSTSWYSGLLGDVPRFESCLVTFWIGTISLLAVKISKQA